MSAFRILADLADFIAVSGGSAAQLARFLVSTPDHRDSNPRHLWRYRDSRQCYRGPTARVSHNMGKVLEWREILSIFWINKYDNRHYSIQKTYLLICAVYRLGEKSIIYRWKLRMNLEITWIFVLPNFDLKNCTSKNVWKMTLWQDSNLRPP